MFGRPIIASDIRLGKCNLNVVLGTKIGQLEFSERQKQLVNSGNKISIPENVLKFESSANLSEQKHFS